MGCRVREGENEAKLMRQGIEERGKNKAYAVCFFKVNVTSVNIVTS